MEGSSYIPHTQVNSVFRARWLAGSEVISKHNHQQPSAKSQGFPKSFLSPSMPVQLSENFDFLFPLIQLRNKLQ